MNREPQRTFQMVQLESFAQAGEDAKKSPMEHVARVTARLDLRR